MGFRALGLEFRVHGFGSKVKSTSLTKQELVDVLGSAKTSKERVSGAEEFPGLGVLGV